jgi:hypothetical protein
VDRVTEGDDGVLVVHAGERSWTTRTLVNATGHLDPAVRAALHRCRDVRGGSRCTPPDYPGPEHFDGKRVGRRRRRGPRRLQFLGELGPRTDVVWVTRRPPVWRDRFDENAGRHAIELVQERVRAGLPPASVVSVTGLALRPQEQEAARLGVYERRRAMFARIEPDGVRWADGSFERADVILWATGFRPAVGHLAPLHLRSEHGGIALLQSGSDVQTATTAVRDARVQLVGLRALGQHDRRATGPGRGRGARGAALPPGAPGGSRGGSCASVTHDHPRESAAAG